jgi:hypothetical protein
MRGSHSRDRATRTCDKDRAFLMSCVIGVYLWTVHPNTLSRLPHKDPETTYRPLQTSITRSHASKTHKRRVRFGL